MLTMLEPHKVSSTITTGNTFNKLVGHCWTLVLTLEL